MIRKLLTTALAAGVVASVSCTDGTTTAPMAQNPATAFHYYPKPQPPNYQPGLVRCERHPTYVGSAEIGPRGGQIIVGRSRVIVPPGALNKTVRITATIPEGEHVTIQFEFDPHGLVFRKPAGLVLDAAGCDIPSYYAPDIVYLGENGEILEYIQSYYSHHWHLVAAPIWHFSRYAIAW